MLFPLYDLIPHRRFPWITVLIIVVNVAILGSQGFAPNVDTVYRYGFIPKRLSEIGQNKPLEVHVLEVDAQGNVVKGPLKKLSEKPNDVYLTFLTTMFLHGNLFHLIMNMWMLWIFGNNVEDHLGRVIYPCFYLLGGMIGTICQWAADPLSTMPIIGASGAVAAVLGAYAITYPKSVVKTLVFVGLFWVFDLPALVVLGVWFMMQMLAGLQIWPDLFGVEHVAIWAHVGGFVAGVVLMPFLSLGASPADADWKREVDEMFQFDDPRSSTKQNPDPE